MKKIYGFCKNSLRNKLGIWLAIGNVGFAVLNYALSYISNYQHREIDIHTHGKDCFTVAESNFTIGEVLYRLTPLQLLWSLLNFPSILVTKVIETTLSEMFPRMYMYTLRNIENWTALFFIAVQWFVIGYLINLFLQKRRKLI